MTHLHRPTIYAAGALALTMAVALEARTWRGDTGIDYPTLEACQNVSKACKPMGRMVRVNDATDIPQLEKARQNFRLAPGMVQEPVIYYSLVSGRQPFRGVMAAAAAADEPKKTRTCHNEKYGTYHKPPCAKHEIEMDVIEARVAGVRTEEVYQFDRSRAYSNFGTFNPAVTVNPVGTATMTSRPGIDGIFRAAEPVNTGTVSDSTRISTVRAVDPPK